MEKPTTSSSKSLFSWNPIAALKKRSKSRKEMKDEQSLAQSSFIKDSKANASATSSRNNSIKSQNGKESKDGDKRSSVQQVFGTWSQKSGHSKAKSIIRSSLKVFQHDNHDNNSNNNNNNNNNYSNTNSKLNSKNSSAVNSRSNSRRGSRSLPKNSSGNDGDFFLDKNFETLRIVQERINEDWEKALKFYTFINVEREPHDMRRDLWVNCLKKGKPVSLSPSPASPPTPSPNIPTEDSRDVPISNNNNNNNNNTNNNRNRSVRASVRMTKGKDDAILSPLSRSSAHQSDMQRGMSFYSEYSSFSSHPVQSQIPQGHNFLVAMDGSEPAFRALGLAIMVMDPAKDHLFVVTVYDNSNPHGQDDLLPNGNLKFLAEQENLIVKHMKWQAACAILRKCETKLIEKKINYTLLVPGGQEAREVVLLIATKWNVHTIFLGYDDKKDRSPAKRKHRPAFHEYLKANQHSAEGKEHFSAVITC